MTQIDDILRLANDFGRARGIGLPRVSTIIFNDGKRLAQLENGADMGVMSATAAIQKFSNEWPRGVKWPKGIRRPKAQREIEVQHGDVA